MKADDPFYKPARILDLFPEKGRRILVISDIHGNLPYFRCLLEKVNYTPDDILIIDGDFLEKGPDSLGTLQYIMHLTAEGDVYTVSGNCDDWARFFVRGNTVRDEYIKGYLRKFRYGILYEILVRLGYQPEEIEDLDTVKDEVYSAYPEEWDFIASLVHAIETPHFIFTHAGKCDKPLREHTAGELFKFDNYMNQSITNEKWVVVGHWPVVLYGTDRVCANPIIDREHKIISIDGGCVLKDDGQLNCFIIPSEDSEDFSFAAYDPFPEAVVLEHQDEGKHSYYIRWGDSTVRVLERGSEMSLCRHERTGYEMRILNKYLFTDEEVTGCNDCTDYILPLEPGDRISIVETTSEGYFVKHNGVSGWYFGKLRQE